MSGVEWAELGGLFAAAFLASTILPGGSEVAFALMLKTQSYSDSLLVLVATLGNTLGGMTSWGIGRVLPQHRSTAAGELDAGESSAGAGPGEANPNGTPSGEHQRTPHQSSPRVARAAAQVRRYGAVVLLASWIPVIGDPLCIAAGWLRIGWLPALLFMALGKAGRYVALAWAL